MHKHYLVSIGAGINQVPLILAIKQQGYGCIACDANPDAPGKDAADIFLHCGTNSPEKLVELLRLTGKPIVGVLTRSSGWPVITCAKVAHAFQLPGVSVHLSEVLVNKDMFIEQLNLLNVPSPKRWQLSDPIEFPVFVKPSRTNISHAAMSVCENYEELIDAYKKAQGVSQNGVVNIEDYLLGQDLVSIDFVHHNQIIHLGTIGELSSGPPAFIGKGWYSATSEQDKAAAEAFSGMQKAMGLNHGFFQTAMKYNQGSSPKIYECHAEIGGDLVNDKFIPFAGKNYDIFANNIRLASGNRPELLPELEPAILLFKSTQADNWEIPHTTKLLEDEYCIASTFITQKEQLLALEHVKSYGFSFKNNEVSE